MAGSLMLGNTLPKVGTRNNKQVTDQDMSDESFLCKQAIYYKI